MPEALTSLGWWAVFLFLLVVVFLRAQATYWVGRGVRGGAGRSRWRERFEGESMRRAQRYLDRWGPVGVPGSFLTIGFQTLVNAAAGFMRMPWPLYTLAMLPGCVAWAGVYTLLGVAADQLIRLISWWALLVLAVVVAVAVVVVRRRRSAATVARTPR